jgi:integrase
MDMNREERAAPVRSVTGLTVPRAGRVESGPDVSLPWRVVDQHGVEVREVSDYLRDTTAGDFSPASVKSYAQALLRWLRFLWAVGVAWDQAGRVEVRDFVLWLRTARCRRPPRRAGGPVPGSVNPRTGKPYLGVGFAPATINHNLAVIAGFYGYHHGRGAGPAGNPVPARRGRGGARPGAHHNPLEPVPVLRRAAYRQKQPQRAPRAIPDGLFDELFAAMGCDRDRALLALYVTTGARPAELLGLVGAYVDYGEQQIAVVRKGTRALQWLPASADALVWLRLYLERLPAGLVGADRPVWWTLRRPWRPLGYDAVRAVLRRANARLATNWTLHDLRHTCAVRMAADPRMTLTDVQTILGHAHLATTQRYLAPRQDEVLAHARAHHEQPRLALPLAGGLGYDAGDLGELFGWQAGR